MEKSESRLLLLLPAVSVVRTQRWSPISFPYIPSSNSQPRPLEMTLRVIWLAVCAAAPLDPRAIRTSFSPPSLPSLLDSAPLAPSYIKPSCSHVALRCRHRCRSYLSLPPFPPPSLPFASTNRLCLAGAVRILSAGPERGVGEGQSRAEQTAAMAAAAAVVRGVIYSRLPCPQMKERGRGGPRGREEKGREGAVGKGAANERTNEQRERGNEQRGRKEEPPTPTPPSSSLLSLFPSPQATPSVSLCENSVGQTSYLTCNGGSAARPQTLLACLYVYLFPPLFSLPLPT